MTIHVIDANNPLPPATGDYEHALEIAEGDMVILAEGAEIKASGYMADGIHALGWVTLLIDGRVTSAQYFGISMMGTLSVGQSGIVSGMNGLSLAGYATDPSNIVNNAGTITAIGVGVYTEADHTSINNSGVITGSAGIWVYPSDSSTASLIINNTGVIRGTGTTAILGTAKGSNTVINSGMIEGSIFFGNGNDIYDGRNGHIAGDIYLFSGKDVALGGSDSETFYILGGTHFIDGGEGIDTIHFQRQTFVDLRVTDVQKTSDTTWDTIRNVENLNGGISSDRFIGNTAANALIGSGGHDTLDGYDGNDLLSGGTGNDLFIGGAGSDTAVFSGKFSDYTISLGEGGTITITDKRTAGDGTDYLGGVEFALFSDRIFTLPMPSAPSPAVVPTPAADPSTPTTSVTPSASTAAPAKNLSFRGGKKAETFEGDSGHDYLNGGLGNDTLTGREGQDTFAFSSKLGAKNVDQITDFQHADDSIKLSKAVFGKIEKGMLSKGAFHIGSKAHDRSDRIIFNEKTGALFYDADGSGTKHAAVKFAQLKAGTLLQADDFFIV